MFYIKRWLRLVLLLILVGLILCCLKGLHQIYSKYVSFYFLTLIVLDKTWNSLDKHAEFWGLYIQSQFPDTKNSDCHWEYHQIKYFREILFVFLKLVVYTFIPNFHSAEQFHVNYKTAFENLGQIFRICCFLTLWLANVVLLLSCNISNMPNRGFGSAF